MDDFKEIYFYVYDYFAYMSMYASCICLVPEEARREGLRCAGTEVIGGYGPHVSAGN